jgi:hypothetical protein
MVSNQRNWFKSQEDHIPTLTTVGGVWKVSAPVVSNAPIIQYSISPCESKNSDRQSRLLSPHREDMVF